MNTAIADQDHTHFVNYVCSGRGPDAASKCAKVMVNRLSDPLSNCTQSNRLCRQR